MTAPAINQPAVVCPKCQGPVWDQMGSKFWGNGLFKSGKQKPRWECKNKECGGAVWDKAAPAPKPAPVTSHPMASKPDSQLPPLLRNQQEEDAADLASKVGVDLTGIQKNLSVYQGITEWYLDTIVPILTKSDIGCTPESVAAGIATVFINSTGGKK